MSLPTLKIELNAVWRHDRWEIVSEFGDCLAVVPRRLIVAAGRQSEYPSKSVGPWVVAIRKEMRRLWDTAYRTMNDSRWGRKYQSMAQTARSRAKSTGRTRGKERKQGATWDERMQANYNAIRFEARRGNRFARQWERWASTVARNLNRREADRQDYSEQDEAAT